MTRQTEKQQVPLAWKFILDNSRRNSLVIITLITDQFWIKKVNKGDVPKNYFAYKFYMAGNLNNRNPNRKWRLFILGLGMG